MDIRELKSDSVHYYIILLPARVPALVRYLLKYFRNIQTKFITYFELLK